LAWKAALPFSKSTFADFCVFVVGDGDKDDDTAGGDFAGVANPPATTGADAKHMAQTKIEYFIVVVMDNEII
jgi:hypothetical protein